MTASADIGVLICDDYAAMRLMLRTVIESEPGLSVVGEAIDGGAAIAEARRLQPQVILLDLAMPRVTGIEALQEIAVVAPASKVVVFSGFSIDSVSSDVVALGAMIYLQKGASPEAIVQAVHDAAAMERAPELRVS